MLIKKPEKDLFTKNIEKITPEGLGDKSQKFKNDLITDTIDGIKGEIKNKVCSLIDLSIQIQTGISKIGSSIGDIDLKGFINTGIDAVQDKLDDAKKLFDSTFDEFKDIDKKIADTLKEQTDAIKNNLKQGIESAKLATQGLVDTASNIANFSNKQIKDIASSLDLKGGLCDDELQKAMKNMEDSAKSQVSNFNVSEKMNQNLIDKSKLIDTTSLTEGEIDKNTVKLTEFVNDSRSKWWSGDRDSLEKMVDPDTGEILGYLDPATGDFIDTDFNLVN